MSSIKDFDFSDVRGQDFALQACARAVGTGRDLVLVGPPGTGKTMIARRIVSIMDPLTDHERAWLDAEYTGVEMQPRGGVVSRPFRAPHHTISQAALVGSSAIPKGSGCPICVKAKREHVHTWHTLPPLAVRRAGELQLARFGVLMLDEIHEFSMAAIDALGHAMRDMTGRPMIVATATECPCGWRGTTERECVCTPSAVARHTGRLLANLKALRGDPEGVKVGPVTLDTLRRAEPGKWTSATLRDQAAYYRDNASITRHTRVQEVMTP